VTDTPRIPTQFVAPPDDADDAPPPLRYVGPNGLTEKEEQEQQDHPHDDPEFRHPDGSPSQIPKPPAALGDPAPERDAEAVAATPAAAAPPSGPEPIAAGTYAVYSDTAGGYVLVIGTREGETHRKHLPGHLVKMAEKMAGGSPLAMLFGGA
jgi:hypothetical protein